MVMQNLYMVHGKPSFSASYLIACFNACGKFAPISYEFSGNPGTDDYGCRAVSRRIGDTDVLNGTLVTIGMAKKEGWTSKNGSKWLTMPEQMLRYRAATFFIRSTAPEISIGFPSTEELQDEENRQLVDVTPPVKMLQDGNPEEKKPEKKKKDNPSNPKSKVAEILKSAGSKWTEDDIRAYFNRIGQEWDENVVIDNLTQILADMLHDENAAKEAL